MFILDTPGNSVCITFARCPLGPLPCTIYCNMSHAYVHSTGVMTPSIPSAEVAMKLALVGWYICKSFVQRI